MDSVKINTVLKINEIYAAFTEHSQDYSDKLMGSQDFWVLILINSGRLNIVTQSGIMIGGAGEAVLFNPNEIHYIYNNGGEYAEYTVIAFSAESDYLSEISNTVIAFSAYRKILTSNILSQLSGDTSDMLPESFKNSEFAAASFAAAVENLLLSFSGEQQPCERLYTNDSVLFVKAVDLLKENIEGRISLTELAEELGISLSHLKRIFAAYTRAGVHEYFLLLKINKAKQLLKDGVSVTETAMLSGFNNQNYFSAAFKRIIGVSPKDFSAAAAKGEKKTVKAKKAPEIKSKSKREEIPSYLL